MTRLELWQISHFNTLQWDVLWAAFCNSRNGFYPPIKENYLKKFPGNSFLSALVKRFSVSRMLDFFSLTWSLYLSQLRKYRGWTGYRHTHWADSVKRGFDDICHPSNQGEGEAFVNFGNINISWLCIVLKDMCTRIAHVHSYVEVSDPGFIWNY